MAPVSSDKAQWLRNTLGIDITRLASAAPGASGPRADGAGPGGVAAPGGDALTALTESAGEVRDSITTDGTALASSVVGDTAVQGINAAVGAVSGEVNTVTSAARQGVGQVADQGLGGAGAVGGLVSLATGSVPAAGDAELPTFNPSVGDPTLQSALTDTVTEFTKGYVKTLGDTAAGIANSPGGQFASGLINPTAPQLSRSIGAAITGDPSKLAPENPFNFNVDPNDPTVQKNAQAGVESTKDLAQGLLAINDPLALLNAAPAAADVLVNGDPNQVGQGAGRTVVITGVALAGGIGEAGAGEAAATEGGAAGADAPAVGAPEFNLGEAPAQPAPQVGAPELSPAANSGPLPQVPGPISGFDPALPAPESAPPITEVLRDAPTVPAQTPGPISGFDPALPPPEPETSPAAFSVPEPAISPAANSEPLP